MVRFLIRVAIFIVPAALGLWVASLLLDDFSIQLAGFVMAVAIFAVVQSLLQPFMLKMTVRYANAFTGGVGLITTFVALLVTSLVGTSLEIRGVVTWVLATLIVWLVTALATLLLPMWWLKNRKKGRKDA